MANRKVTDKVRFYLGIGYVSADHTETQTLAELGFEQEYLDDMDDDELESQLNDAQEEWAANYIDSGWGWEE